MRTDAWPRTPLKAAARIHEQVTRREEPRLPDLPCDDLEQLRRIAGRVRFAQERGWEVALEVLREEARNNVRGLQRRIDDWLYQLPRDRGGLPAASVREIHADLRALEEEFDEFRIDLREGTLSAVTEPITLEYVELGRFRIVLRWEEIGNGHPYDVVALDDSAARFDSTTTHPHVRDEELCEGEGRAPIGAALRSGRMFDFFVLVRQVLQTYNPQSAYVRLERWNGRECTDCGDVVSDDESTCCERCDRNLCGDCAESCGECHQDCCGNCRGRCDACESTVCDRCAAWCDDCSERFCPDCLKDGTCESCRKENERDEKPAETPPSLAAERDLPAEAAVHAVGVGEALVPA